MEFENVIVSVGSAPVCPTLRESTATAVLRIIMDCQHVIGGDVIIVTVTLLLSQPSVKMRRDSVNVNLELRAYAVSGVSLDTGIILPMDANVMNLPFDKV